MYAWFFWKEKSNINLIYYISFLKKNVYLVGMLICLILLMWYKMFAFLNLLKQLIKIRMN